MSLEYANYSKMVIRDVNSYIGVYKNGETKKKGIFETKLDFHKNHSALIIPKALEQHFIYGNDYKKYILEHDDVFDFCYLAKKKSNFKLLLENKYETFSILTEQQKNLRYIISNKTDKSGYLFKYFNDGRVVSIGANKLIEEHNIITDKEAKHYSINYDDYINETEKIIKTIENE